MGEGRYDIPTLRTRTIWDNEKATDVRAACFFHSNLRFRVISGKYIGFYQLCQNVAGIGRLGRDATHFDPIIITSAGPKAARRRHSARKWTPSGIKGFTDGDTWIEGRILRCVAWPWDVERGPRRTYGFPDCTWKCAWIRLCDTHINTGWTRIVGGETMSCAGWIVVSMALSALWESQL